MGLFQASKVFIGVNKGFLSDVLSVVKVIHLAICQSQGSIFIFILQ